MNPFITPSGSVIDLGKENKSLTLKVINIYLRFFSKNKFRGGKVREYGLLFNKRIISCSTSPDVFCIILKARRQNQV